jgi:UDP-glucose 4-epimerase
MVSNMILIIGGNGFLGSWFALNCFATDKNFTVLTSQQSNISRIAQIPQTSIVQLKPSEWPGFITKLRPTQIVSFDWAGVTSEQRNSAEIQNLNISRVLQVAQAGIESGVKTFLTFGSQAENGPINRPADEYNYDSPTTAYGAAKVALRLQLEDKFRTTESKLIWGRIFSTYGEMDNRNWLIPSLIRSLKQNKEFSLTSGEQVWSYLHAKDFVTAINLLLSLEFSKNMVVNIGNPEVQTIQTVAKIIGEKLGVPELLSFGTTQFRPDQVTHLEPTTATLNLNGWKPSVDMNQGVADILRWYSGEKIQYGDLLLPNASSLEMC